MATLLASGAILAGTRQRVSLALVPLALLWLGVLWAAIGGRAPGTATSNPPPLPAVLQTVTATGEPAPTEGSFGGFDAEGRVVPAPANRRGDVVFFARLLRSSAEEGLFLSSGGRTLRLAAVGDSVPGGERIAGFGEHPGIAINEAGAVAFAARLTGGKATSGVFLAQNGKLASVALSGAAAPDVSGGTLADFEAPALNDAGEVTFLAALRRGREASEAIYVWRRGQLVKVAAAGDAAPSGGNFTSFAVPALNNNGDIAFGALVEQGPVLGGIYVVSGRERRLVLAAGNPAPTGGIFARFSEQLELNDAGAIAFSAVLREGGPGSALFVIENDVPRTIVATGDAAPGGGSFAAFASWPVLSQSGAVAFIASLDGGPNGLGVFLAGPEGLKRVATVGDTLPGGDRLAAFPLYPALAIAPNDAVTFNAFAERDGARADTLFFYGPPRRGH
jgi:hypothetical protein